MDMAAVLLSDAEQICNTFSTEDYVKSGENCSRGFREV